MRLWVSIIVFWIIFAISGCAGIGESVSTFLRAGPWWLAAQTDGIGARARALEARGELAMALDHWRLVEQIALDQTEAQREIARLETRIADAVAFHYQDGLEKIKSNAVADARNHFLAALRLDPSFEPAREQINAYFSPFPLVTYRSLSGDRPATVAKNVFGDADNAFLVAWFNDLPADGVIPPDTLLLLPKLKKVPPKKKPKKQPPDQLREARMRLAADDFEGALALVGHMDATDPAVQSLTHTIHLKQAAVQTEAGFFGPARQSLSVVPNGFMGKGAVLEMLRSAIQKQQLALDMEKAHLFFDDKDYQQSFDLAESVRWHTPENIDARDLSAEARYRLALDHVDHRQLLEARTLLEKADENHAASVELKKSVSAKLMEMAQTYYRNGVKHFINEDLEAAVTDWEQALICNPDHEKARENIENARRLMQKLETMP